MGSKAARKKLYCVIVGSAVIGSKLMVGQKFTTTPLAIVERHWLLDEIADWLKFDLEKEK
jgi:hypothetical protein